MTNFKKIALFLVSMFIFAACASEDIAPEVEAPTAEYKGSGATSGPPSGPPPSSD